MEEHWGGGRFGADDMLSFVLNLEDQFTHRKYPARSCRQGAGPQKMLVKGKCASAGSLVVTHLAQVLIMWPLLLCAQVFS